MENIELTVKKIVSEQLGIPIDQIKNSMSFIEDLGGDSLDTVEMLLYVEDIYNLNIDEEVMIQHKIKSILNSIYYNGFIVDEDVEFSIINEYLKSHPNYSI